MFIRTCFFNRLLTIFLRLFRGSFWSFRLVFPWYAFGNIIFKDIFFKTQCKISSSVLCDKFLNSRLLFREIFGFRVFFYLLSNEVTFILLITVVTLISILTVLQSQISNTSQPNIKSKLRVKLLTTYMCNPTLSYAQVHYYNDINNSPLFLLLQLQVRVVLRQLTYLTRPCLPFSFFFCEDLLANGRETLWIRR